MNFVDELRNDAAGLAVLKDWLGAGGFPIERNKAEMRAAICIACPEHRAFKWWETAKDLIAETMRKHLEIKNRIKIFTSVDEKLFVCRACGCCVRAKVQVDIKHILAHTSDETMAALDPKCWILSEAKT